MVDYVRSALLFPVLSCLVAAHSLEPGSRSRTSHPMVPAGLPDHRALKKFNPSAADRPSSPGSG